MERSEDAACPERQMSEADMRDATADQRDIDLETSWAGAAARDDMLDDRAAEAGEWERRLDERSEVLDGRDERASLRAAAQGQRTARADERDRVADLRDRDADRRDQEADQREIDQQVYAWREPDE